MNHIAEMLRSQKKGHISFHTPGHKRAGADITELSYSDNLSSPSGVLSDAEKGIAEEGSHEELMELKGRYYSLNMRK